MTRRPSGVTFLAIVYLILGGLSLLWSGLVFGIGGLSAATGWLFGQESIQQMGSSGLSSGFFGVLSAALQLVTGFGLLSMKRWAWLLALVTAGITVIQGLMGMFSGGFFGFLCGSIWLIVPVVIVFYLLKPDVRRAFGRQATATPVSDLPSQQPALPAELPLGEKSPAEKAVDDMLIEKPVDPDTLPPSDDPFGTIPPEL